MISGSQGHKATHHPPPRIGHQHRCGSSCRRFCQEVYYTDGGHSTRYFGSDDDVQRYKATMILLGRHYTFEEKDQPESSVHSSTSQKPCSSPSTPSSPIIMIVPLATISTTGSKSPLHYPSLEV